MSKTEEELVEEISRKLEAYLFKVIDERMKTAIHEYATTGKCKIDISDLVDCKEKKK